jgi:hypothetical protein
MHAHKYMHTARGASLCPAAGQFPAKAASPGYPRTWLTFRSLNVTRRCVEHCLNDEMKGVSVTGWKIMRTRQLHSAPWQYVAP